MFLVNVNKCINGLASTRDFGTYRIPLDKSYLGSCCLQYWLPKIQADERADDKIRDCRGKGLFNIETCIT